MAKFDTGMDVSMISNIKNHIIQNSDRLTEASVGTDGDSRIDKSMRNCSTFDIDKPYWLTQLLSSYIHEVNQQVFRFDLTTWHDPLQFLQVDL